nr:hypothetical protein [Tanacetum cinerariifolium]
MANLEFCDTYNMVAYLLKIEGTDSFYHIMDFLNTSHIKYALTENPTIYTSLIQQFWQTAAANTLDTREVQITTTIDGKVKLVSEASIRRHLKLEDSNGISTCLILKSLSNLLLWVLYCLSPKKNSWEQFSSNIATAIICLATNMSFNFFKMIFEGMVKDLDNEPAFTGVDVRHGGATTTVSSLDTGQGNDNINKTLYMPHDSPLLRVYTLGCDEGRMQQNELIDLVSKLTDILLALETNLPQTKKVYNTAVTKLIMKEYEFETEHISTIETLVYIRGSASKDKGKCIMTESEHKQTSTKLQQRQERAGYEAVVRLVKTFTPMESDFDRTIPKIADESSKRVAKEELEQESSKRQKTRKSSELREKEDDELTQEDLQQMVMIVPVEEVYVEALKNLENIGKLSE